MSTPKICWYIDQKTTLVRKNGMKARTRERSSAFVCGEVHMTMT
ncbi:Uncharacterised protein [Mycobacteroides abscessus subsp. abscessus]|nr:Uncharacterised protein [Mycobacteroides abscessus subsp. abscessus]